MDTGDLAAAYDLLDPELVYLSTGIEPVEIRGRDQYSAFIGSLKGFYTAPRSHEILGIDSHTPTMAALRVRVTVGELSALSIVFHYVRDGRVVELIDVIEDRGRMLAPFVRRDAVEHLQGPRP